MVSSFWVGRTFFFLKIRTPADPKGIHFVLFWDIVRKRLINSLPCNIVKINYNSILRKDQKIGFVTATKIGFVTRFPSFFLQKLRVVNFVCTIFFLRSFYGFLLLLLR